MVCCAPSFQNTVQHRTWLRALVRSSQSTVEIYHDPVCKAATRKSQVSVPFAPLFFITPSCSPKLPMLGGMICCASWVQNRSCIPWWFQDFVWLSKTDVENCDDCAACRISASCSIQKRATATYHVLGARGSASAASLFQRWIPKSEWERPGSGWWFSVVYINSHLPRCLLFSYAQKLVPIHQNGRSVPSWDQFSVLPPSSTLKEDITKKNVFLLCIHVFLQAYIEQLRIS